MKTQKSVWVQMELEINVLSKLDLWRDNFCIWSSLQGSHYIPAVAGVSCVCALDPKLQKKAKMNPHSSHRTLKQCNFQGLATWIRPIFHWMPLCVDCGFSAFSDREENVRIFALIKPCFCRFKPEVSCSTRFWRCKDLPGMVSSIILTSL